MRPRTVTADNSEPATVQRSSGSVSADGHVRPAATAAHPVARRPALGRGRGAAGPELGRRPHHVELRPRREELPGHLCEPQLRRRHRDAQLRFRRVACGVLPEHVWSHIPSAKRGRGKARLYEYEMDEQQVRALLALFAQAGLTVQVVPTVSSRPLIAAMAPPYLPTWNVHYSCSES